MAWPSSIPIPGPEEFCVGLICGKRACLLGWLNIAFDHPNMNAGEITSEAYERGDNKERLKFGQALCKAAGVAFGYTEHPFSELWRWSDSHYAEDRAEVWKKAADEFGYTEVYEA